MGVASKDVIRRGFLEGFNEGRLEVFDEITDDAYVDHEAPDQAVVGPEQVKGVYRWLKAAFPDFRFEIADMIAEDDKVWTHVVFSGTHEGEFMGVAPTGTHFAARQVHMHLLRDGRAIEHRAVRDDLTMLRQLQG